MDSSSLFACLLVGQPTLRRRIKLGVLAALDQRIALRYAMPPMTPEETGSYLKHHLALAGRTDTLFSDDAATLIHQTSRGYPRAVNNLAIQALVAAFAANKNISMSPPPEPRSAKSRQSEHHQITTMTKAPPSIRRRGFPLPAHPHRQRLPRPQRKRRVTTGSTANWPTCSSAPQDRNGSCWTWR